MKKKKIIILIVAIIIIIVLAIGPGNLLEGIKKTDIVSLKCTVTFEKGLDVPQLEELEKNYGIHIEGVEASFKDEKGELATSLIVFSGYDALYEEMTNISERTNSKINGISGIYVISKYSQAEELKQEDKVYAVESNIAMPQAKSGFGAYKETKTWELNK